MKKLPAFFVILITTLFCFCSEGHNDKNLSDNIDTCNGTLRFHIVYNGPDSMSNDPCSFNQDKNKVGTSAFHCPIDDEIADSIGNKEYYNISWH